MPRGYLIRVPKRKDRLRAIELFWDVPYTRHGFTDYRWLVTPAHVEALKQAGIPFEDLTDVPPGEDLLKKKTKKKKTTRRASS